MDFFPRNRFDRKRDQYIYLSSSHYKLRLETTLGINAKAFFKRSKHSDLDDFLVETDLSLGEVVEIDDGLRPTISTTCPGQDLSPYHLLIFPVYRNNEKENALC